MCCFVCVFQAYSDTLQTQWSWLLQITKCIDTHLKENGAYSQVEGLNIIATDIIALNKHFMQSN